VSDDVLDAVARALQLNDAEREHLFNLARAARPVRTPNRRTRPQIPPSVQRVLDSMTGTAVRPQRAPGHPGQQRPGPGPLLPGPGPARAPRQHRPLRLPRSPRRRLLPRPRRRAGHRRRAAAHRSRPQPPRQRPHRPRR
jgi:hypothetical protein